MKQISLPAQFVRWNQVDEFRCWVFQCARFVFVFFLCALSSHSKFPFARAWADLAISFYMWNCHAYFLPRLFNINTFGWCDTAVTRTVVQWREVGWHQTNYCQCFNHTNFMLCFMAIVFLLCICLGSVVFKRQFCRCLCICFCLLQFCQQWLCKEKLFFVK